MGWTDFYGVVREGGNNTGIFSAANGQSKADAIRY